MEVLDVLTDARALVAKGWQQNGWFTVDSKGGIKTVCTAGAIRLAAAKTDRIPGANCSCGCGAIALDIGVVTETRMGLGAGNILADVIRERFPAWVHIDRHSIPEWNDAPYRTKEQVLSVFDEAIERLTPPPPEPVFAGPIVALPQEYGQSKVTYTVSFVKAPSWVPDYVPESLTDSVLVSTG